MNRFLAYIFLTFVVLSCGDIDKPKKPDNFISKSKMIDIITDISLVNAAKAMDKNLLIKKDINPEDYIFQKYDIDSVQFAENSNYYAYYIKEYEEIYSQVKERLEKQKETYKAIEEKEKKERDSIRKSKVKKIDTTESKKTQIELFQKSKSKGLLKKDRKPQ